MRALQPLTSACLVFLCGFATTPCRADDKDDVKKAIATQFDLLKAGKTEELKAHFTNRLRDKITPEVVEKAKQTAKKFALDDLVAAVEITQQGKTKAASIKMKSGRTLTSLLLTDGKWLADTIWFK